MNEREKAALAPKAPERRMKKLHKVGGEYGSVEECSCQELLFDPVFLEVAEKILAPLNGMPINVALAVLQKCETALMSSPVDIFE